MSTEGRRREFTIHKNIHGTLTWEGVGVPGQRSSVVWVPGLGFCAHMRKK